MKKRVFDIILSIVLFPILIFPILLIVLILKSISRDNVFFWSERVGKNGVIFKMPKFRSMLSHTPITPIIENPKKYYNAIGKFLRHSSLDELPQLYSIFKGDMSFVGPRPASPAEDTLVKLRDDKKINTITPGLTGLAQINGRDKITVIEKVELDSVYMQQQCLWLDVKILFITIIKTIKQTNISH